MTNRKFRSITVFTNIIILTLQAVISYILYRTNTTLITGVLMEDKLNYLFVICALSDNFRLMLPGEGLLCKLYCSSTACDLFFNLMELSGRLVLLFWKYQALCTAESFTGPWTLYKAFLVVTFLLKDNFLLLRFWRYTVNMDNIVIIWPDLGKSHFRFLFPIVKLWWMRQMLHAVVDFIQGGSFTDQTYRLEIFSQLCRVE